MESAIWLEKQGFKITRIKVDKYGLVNPKDVKKAIRKDTILVSIIHASNEIGTIQPIDKIGKICQRRGVFFHTDAVQSFGKIPIDANTMNIDLLTYSSGIAADTSAIGEKYGYVTIAPLANGDFVYERGFKYLFSVTSMATGDLIPVAQLAVQQTPKPKTFATVVLDHVFTLPSIEGVKKRSVELGLQEVYYGKFPANTTDFSGMLTAIKSKEPDLLYFGGFFPDAVSFYRQAKELNVNAKLYTTTGTAGHRLGKCEKKDGDYVLAQVTWHPDLPYKDAFLTSRSFATFWKQKYGEEADFFNACGYVAGVLM